MAWKHYQVVFRVLSPLHIGYRKVGNLMQTRSYVLGRNLWGAITARLVRDAGKGNDAQAYFVMGEVVRSCFRFGYLYPAIPRQEEGRKNRSGNVEPYFPWDSKAVPFDYLFLSSYASTSLDYEFQAALAGSLHETEFISPCTRPLRGTAWEGGWGEEADALGLPVYLIGDLWVAEDCQKQWQDWIKSNEGKKKFKDVSDLLKFWCAGKLSSWRQALDKIQLGGERGYGWGRVELLEGYPLECDELIDPRWRWDKTATNDVVLEGEEGAFLLAHTLAVSDNGKPLDIADDIEGPIEPLVGRETRMNEKTGFGVVLSQARICWTPGDKIGKKLRVIVDWDGVWKPIS